jgi:hypothetical protein
MPTYSKGYEQELISKVRQILDKKPDISCRQISEVMANNNIVISKDYALKIIKKIQGERANRYNNAAAKEAVAKFEDFLKVMNEELLKLKDSTKLDVVKAMCVSNMVKNYKMLLDMQFDIGVFERQIGKIKTEHVNVAEVLKLLKDERDAQQNQKRNIGDGS